MHYQGEMDEAKVEGKKLYRSEVRRGEGGRLKPFRCAMMERGEELGQIKVD